MSHSYETPTPELLERLRAGETPAAARRACGLEPAQFVMTLVRAGLDSEDPADWPGLRQARPRRPWLAEALDEPSLAEAFPDSTRPARLALAAGLLQVHDFWDASHEAAQQADDLGERSFSTYWHGIAHRREPDPGNAAYWFRRVGRHPVFKRLAAESRPMIVATGDPALLKSLLGDAVEWNPFAFIDFCTSARPGSEPYRLGLWIQRIEMAALLDATLKAL